MRIGILGGTFDPIHNGHLAIGRRVAAQCQLDRIILIPSSVPPHRPAPHADATQRAALCRLAADADPLYSVSDIELTRSGPSYTYDTLAALATPSDTLFLILGGDAAALLPQWYRAAELGFLCELVVVDRPGSACDTAAIETAIPAFAGHIHRVTDNKLTVSSSEIRARLARGAAVDEMIPPAVADYIATEGLYRSTV
ncbi:MAG: nicotinic acid mononucleotide adenylyltransferase [Chloroflexota bacterium]|jgi:nicotinate-nucleotide adenylyltransferase